MSRMQADQQFSAAGEQFKIKYVIQCLGDIKTWIGGVYFCSMPYYRHLSADMSWCSAGMLMGAYVLIFL